MVAITSMLVGTGVVGGDGTQVGRGELHFPFGMQVSLTCLEPVKYNENFVLIFSFFEI